MSTHSTIRRAVAAAFLAGGVAATGLALTTPAAQAAPGCPRLQACTQWCPGDPNPAGRPVPWDNAVCHQYYWDSYGVHDVGDGAFYSWSKMGW